jgi:hypothetical protein
MGISGGTNHNSGDRKRRIRVAFIEGSLRDLLKHVSGRRGAARGGAGRQPSANHCRGPSRAVRVSISVAIRPIAHTPYSSTPGLTSLRLFQPAGVRGWPAGVGLTACCLPQAVHVMERTSVTADVGIVVAPPSPRS